MAISVRRFKQEYLAASRELGLPAPSEAKMAAEYEDYKYGTTLLVGPPKVRFFKSEEGDITWDVGPAA